MPEDFEEQRRKQIALRRSIADYVMGALFLLLGIGLLLHNTIGFDFGPNKTPILDIVFGIMCVVYGAWRLYRGYKKDYFK